VRQPGWIGGVSTGIADRIGVDVLVVRGILVVVALLGGPAVLLYALAWLVLPDTTGRIHLEDLVHGRIDTPVVGIVVLVALSLLPMAQGFWWFGSLYLGAPQWGDSVGRAIWTLVVLALVAWLVVWFARRKTPRVGSPTNESRDEPTPADGPTSDAAVSDAVAADSAQDAPDAAAGDPTWRAGQQQWRANRAAFRQEHGADAFAAAEAAKRERAARAAAARERERRTRPHPLVSAAVIGAALVAGAITTLALGSGSPTMRHWLVGAAVAVGVLGLGVIVNGATGRRSGGSGSVAVLLALVLLVAAVLPQTTQRHYFGDLSVTPTQQPGTHQVTYLEGFGTARIDLTKYYSTPRPKSTPSGGLQGYDQITLDVLSGDVTVVLPADEYQYVDFATASGHITTSDGEVVDGEYARSINLPSDPHGDRITRELDVRVHVLSGNIHFVEQEDGQ
jgi:phage shock protein PspC (stress-responsive transcriptional regulator)